MPTAPDSPHHESQDQVQVTTATTDLLREHGDGPSLLVLLHAAGSGPRALDRLAKTLTADGLRTAAPAFELAGRSLIGGTDQPFASAIALARHLLDRPNSGQRLGQRPGSRVLFGHSMGGLVALKAIAVGAHADALVLYEPIVLSLLDPADPEDGVPLAADRACIAEFRDAVASGRPEAGVRRFIEAYGDTPWPHIPEPSRALLVARAESLLAEAEATNAAVITPAEISARAVPTLLLTGTRSPAVLTRMAARLAAVLPGIECASIESAGHMGPITHATAVAEAIRLYLRRM